MIDEAAKQPAESQENQVQSSLHLTNANSFLWRTDRKGKENCLEVVVSSKQVDTGLDKNPTQLPWLAWDYSTKSPEITNMGKTQLCQPPSQAQADRLATYQSAPTHFAPTSKDPAPAEVLEALWPSQHKHNQIKLVKITKHFNWENRQRAQIHPRWHRWGTESTFTGHSAHHALRVISKFHRIHQTSIQNWGQAKH